VKLALQQELLLLIQLERALLEIQEVLQPVWTPRRVLVRNSMLL